MNRIYTQLSPTLLHTGHMSTLSMSTLSTAPHTLYRVGVVQMTATDDRERNFKACARLVHQAALQHVQFLSFPECFHFIGGGPTTLGSIDIAEPLDGETIQKYQTLAKENNMNLSLGGFQERSPDPTKVYNTHVVIDSLGNIVQRYRKIHLFDYAAGGLMESSFTLPGDDIKTVGGEGASSSKEIPLTIGLSTCYDLRFPEMYQRLRQLHSKIILIPSAFTMRTGVAHWETLLRCRAIETQCFVVAAAQAGQHNEKRTSYGHALIVDPWGTIVAEGEGVGVEEEGKGKGKGKVIHHEQLLVADLNMELLESVRAKMPIMSHKRYDVYGGNEEGGKQ